MSVRDKLQQNIEAIRLILQNISGKYTTAQLETLQKYSGFGGIKCILYDPYINEDWSQASESDWKLKQQIWELHELLKEEMTGREYKQAIESLKNGTLSQFYTPAVICNTFYQVLKKYMYVDKMLDPSGGSGVFVRSTAGIISVNKATVYEKDLLTGKILQAIMTGMNIPVDVHIKPFEESVDIEDGTYDLVATNPPYGAFAVYDEKCQDSNIYKKIHNYFVWKGLQKLKDGGIMVYLISSAFLDTVTNSKAREYLFMHADLISVVVMPDNLMKESANTEAPSHFIVVRKHVGKTEMSEEEKLLCVSENVNRSGTVISMNKYLQEYGHECTIGDIKVGKNQYGKPSIAIWWNGKIEDVAEPFSKILQDGFQQRYHTTIEKEAIKALEWQEHQDDKITQYPHDHGAVIVQVAEDEQEMPPNLVEAFQKIGEIMGASLESVSNTVPPWEELQNHIQIPEDTAVDEEVCTICEGPLAPSEVKRGTHVACEDKEAELEVEEEAVDELWNELIEDTADENEVLEIEEDGSETPTDVEDEETIYTAPQSDTPAVEPDSAPKVKTEIVNNLFSEIRPFKPGILVEHKVCSKDLFTDQVELIKILKIKQTSDSGLQEIEYMDMPLKPKEAEVVREYLKLRDTYLQLEQLENQ